MARPRKYYEDRVTTAVRLPRSLHEQLGETADYVGASVNFLITLACKEYLERLGDKWSTEPKVEV